MNEQNGFVPLRRDLNFILNLIHGLKEGQEIFFSKDNETGHRGSTAWIKKASNGREWELHAGGDLVEHPYLESDEDIEELAKEILANHIYYYSIYPIPGYEAPRHREEPDDSQEVGDYERNGADPITAQYEHKTTMKKELLEYLIRTCAKQILCALNENTNENDETQGAAAPPEDGQGTADTPEIPKDKDTSSEESPEAKETPSSPIQLQGVMVVNPKDKSRVQNVPLPPNINDATLEKTLHQLAKAMGGSHNVKIALSTFRLVKQALKNPTSATFLYLGKNDPDSDELFLLADKSVEVAKDASASEQDLNPQDSGNPSSGFEPSTADADAYAQHMTSGGMRQAVGIDENMRTSIKAIVNQILNEK